MLPKPYRMLHVIRTWMGVELTPTDHREKVISAVAGFVGIAVVTWVSIHTLGPEAACPVVASMGASAVLLFAAPHGALSQPWPVLGGHLLSAAVGVTCCRFIPDARVAGPASVGLAIGAMYYARCVHPPGGATALTAVLGGAGIQRLGYSYLLTPVLLNTVVLLTVAVVANAPFAWRRYPAALIQRRRRLSAASRGPASDVISHDHLSFALRKMGSLIDVTEDDLAEIYTLAAQHAQGTHLAPEQIRVGGCYANRRDDPRWAIRQVVDELPAAAGGSGAAGSPEDDVVLYWTLAGHDGRGAGTCTRAAMALWAHEEVSPVQTPAQAALT